MFRFAFVFVTAFAVTIASFARAHEYKLGTLKIVHPWARATPKGAAVGGGYMSITNTGKTADRLVGGKSTIAKDFEVHRMTMENGVMKMRMLRDGLEIKPGETVTLKPGGFHVMFTGLKQPLVKGRRVKATLQFQKAGKVDVEFVVEGIGAMNGGGGMHGGGAMHMNH